MLQSNNFALHSGKDWMSSECIGKLADSNWKWSRTNKLAKFIIIILNISPDPGSHKKSFWEIVWTMEMPSNAFASLEESPSVEHARNGNKFDDTVDISKMFQFFILIKL
jgi:hypothetical protein